MKAIVVGCSHAAGAQMHLGPECTLADPVAQTNWELQNSFPMQFARSKGYTPYNYSISGGSNDAMFRICAETIPDTDVIIACWTGSDRYEVAGQVVQDGEYYKQRVAHETVEDGRLNKIKNILAVNSLASYYNCLIFNFDSFQGIYDFNWPANVNRPLLTPEQEFCTWSFAQGFTTESTGHFFLPAHDAYAKYLVDLF